MFGLCFWFGSQSLFAVGFFFFIFWELSDAAVFYIIIHGRRRCGTVCSMVRAGNIGRNPVSLELSWKSVFYIIF